MSTALATTDGGMTRSLRGQLRAALDRRDRTEDKRERNRLGLRIGALRRQLTLQAKADRWAEVLGHDGVAV